MGANLCFGICNETCEASVKEPAFRVDVTQAAPVIRLFYIPTSPCLYVKVKMRVAVSSTCSPRAATAFHVDPLRSSGGGAERTHRESSWPTSKSATDGDQSARRLLTASEGRPVW